MSKDLTSEVSIEVAANANQPITLFEITPVGSTVTTRLAEFSESIVFINILVPSAEHTIRVINFL